MIRRVPCMAGCDGPMLGSMLPGRASRWIRASGSMSDIVLERQARLAQAPGIGLAQRVALEALVGQDPAEIGVALEADTEHVEDLPLEPLGVLPQPDEARDRGSRGGDRGLEAQTDMAGHRIEMIDELEPAL